MKNILRRKLRKGISFVAACAIMATNVSPWLVTSYASEVPEEAYYEGADEYYEEASEKYFETPEVTMTPEAESADAYFEGSAEPTEAPSEAPDAADEAEYGLEETPDQEEAEVPDYEIDEMEDPDGDGIAEGVEAPDEMFEEDAFEEDAFENDASEDDAETPDGQILENAPSVIFEESTEEVRVTVVAGLGVFPEGTTMEVKPAEDEETISKVSESVEDEKTKVTGVKAVDVTFYNAEHEEIEPNGPVFVTLEDLTKLKENVAEEPAQKPEDAKAVHVTDEGECSMMAAASEEDLQYLPMEWEEDQAEDSIKKIEQLNEEATVAFLAESFSTYALVYTVDFHWEVDGQVYEYSLAGGDSVSFRELVGMLGIFETAESENYEVVEAAPAEEVSSEAEEAPAEESIPEAAEEEAPAEEIVEDVEAEELAAVNAEPAEGLDEAVKEYTEEIEEPAEAVVEEPAEAAPVYTIDDFIDDIESIEFSDESLVYVAKVDEGNTFDGYVTAGELKEMLGLECEYSAELTEEQIAQMNDKAFYAPDWALISLRAFDTEESLVVTMKTGESFEIRVTDAQIKKTVLSASGETYEITVTYGEDAQIPDGSSLEVEEILPDDERYQEYFRKSLEKIESIPENKENPDEEEDPADTDSEKEVPGKKLDSDYAHIFDIEIWNGDQKIEPAADVTVNIRLLDTPEEEEGIPAVVHFAKDGVEVMEQAEDSEDDVIQFVTDEFSVYSVVYTVDFLFNINGKVCSFSLEGGDSTSFREIIEKFELLEEEDIDDFINNIATVEFTNPDYLWNGKLTEDAFAGELKDNYNLDIQYASNIRQGNILAMNNHHYNAPDWVLIALKPFLSEETLTVTLKNGESFTAIVTDAQSDAIHNSDGTVQTVSNPAGTTIDLFDYWVSIDTKTTAGRDQWPGHIHDEKEFWKFNWYDLNGNYADSWGDGWNHNDEWKNSHLLGGGNNIGINKDHAFKFSPANAGTVMDGTKGVKTVDGQYGVNSWTKDADPQQGIVENILTDGYPKLTENAELGTDGESLAYLFNGVQVEGKQGYPGVNKLLYVDPEGYYTYDSRDFKAEYQSDGTFKVSNQPNSTDTELTGFWPFGNKVYWVGMHMNTQFSMPANGQVLNPRGEYKDMQFEFSGDDDTWLYIDGVLVGDGGGIHNRTEIDINFATGKVIVTGTKDTVHTGDFTYEDTLYNFFKKVKGENNLNPEEWMDVNGDNIPDTFAVGTYHTFDMFYLERGGGESNLYIHYNLVSTADFTGHKAYEGFSQDQRMLRDQFQFELIGLDGRYESVPDGVDESGKTKYKLEKTGWSNDSQNLDINKSAIMPVSGTPDGAGTVASPKKVSGTVPVGGQPVNATIYTTGVTEDGNINFGFAEINATEEAAYNDGHASAYKYIIREIVPDNAVNSAGTLWSAASEEEKKAGGFVHDGVTYDGTIYYMVARVTSWDQHGSDGNTYKEYGLSKTYYTDDTFTTVANDVDFVSFLNTKVGMKYGDVDFEKVDAIGNPLSGAEFTLYKDEACKTVVTNKTGKRMAISSDTDGNVSFEDVAVGTYYMKETKAPTGYELDNTIYKVTIADSSDSTAKSTIIVNGDGTNTPVERIVNEKPGELIVKKNWIDQNENPISGAGKTATVHLNRRHMVGTETAESHAATIDVRVMKYGFNYWGEGNQGEYFSRVTSKTVEGSTVTFQWYDGQSDNFNYTIKVNGKNPVEGYSNNLEGNNYIFTKSPTDNNIRQLVVSDVDGDIDVQLRYHTNWLLDNGHIGRTNTSASITAAGGSISYSLMEDTTFNTSSDPDRTKSLSYPNLSATWQLGSEKFPLKDSDGEDWLYYITEDSSEDFELVGYSSNNNPGVSDHGVLEVTNKIEIPPSGSLKIIKNVHYNDRAANTDTEKALVNGNYQFTVKKNGTEITGSPFTISVKNGISSSILIPDLEPGEDYTIEEKNSGNLVLKSVSGGSNVTNSIVTATVTAGKCNEEDLISTAIAEFTNNYTAYEVIIVKKDAENTDTRLGGAVFDLYADASVQNGQVKDGETPLKRNLITNNSGTDKGKVSLGSLATGTYYLFETQAPDGYNLLDVPVIINVEDGRVSLTQGSRKEIGTIVQEKTELTVMNTPGEPLPASGGPGTRGFLYTGLALLFFATLFGLAWRRKRI